MNKREYSHTHGSINDVTKSIRQQTFSLLDKNHLLSPLDLCKLMDLDHKLHGGTIRQYKSAWKREYRNRPAPKCLSFHKARGWIYALKSFSRGELGSEERARLLLHGWKGTFAKNGMIIFKVAGLGRLEWFGTGRVNFWIDKPANWGKVKQLLAYGFLRTGQIADVEKFDLWASAARFKGAHATLDLGERIPYFKISFLKESLGVIFKGGDLSHPTSAEIEFCFPDWAERNEKLLEQNKRALDQNCQAFDLNSQTLSGFSDLLKDLFQPKRLDPADRGMIS